MSGRGNFQGTTARFWLGKRAAAAAAAAGAMSARGKGGGAKRHRRAPRGGGGTQGIGAGLAVCPDAVEMLATLMLSEMAGVESMLLPAYSEAFGVVMNCLENVIDDMVTHDINVHDALMLFDLFCSHGGSSSSSSS